MEAGFDPEIHSLIILKSLSINLVENSVWLGDSPVTVNKVYPSKTSQIEEDIKINNTIVESGNLDI
tara:strand:+ start:408 stop:605 length:198 start_codon:yes stop_codon:yes gene_type:complete